VSALSQEQGANGVNGGAVGLNGHHINHGSFGAVPVFAQLRRMAYLHETESAPQRWFMSAPSRVAQA
jgi:hypothetical protein